MRQSAASYYSEILQQGQKERDVERAFEAQIGEHCDQYLFFISVTYFHYFQRSAVFLCYFKFIATLLKSPRTKILLDAYDE